MSILNVFKSFPSMIRGIFNKSNVTSLVSVLEQVAPVVNQAYPYVARVAELTGNRTAKEILRAYESYGVAELFNSKQPKNEAIRDLVRTLVSRHTQSQGLSNYMLNTAIELAYAQYRTELAQAETVTSETK